MRFTRTQILIILTIICLISAAALAYFYIYSNSTKPSTNKSLPALGEKFANPINVLESRNRETGSKARYQLHITVPLNSEVTPTALTLVSKKGGPNISELSLKMSEVQSSCERGETDKINYVKYETPWFSAQGNDIEVDSNSSLVENYQIQIFVNDKQGNQFVTDKEISEMCFVYINTNDSASSEDFVPLNDADLE